MVAEHAFDDRLTVVEGALNGEGMHVLLRGRCHHSTLHVGNAALGKKYEHVGSGAPAKCIDGGRARVARGGNNDGSPLATGGQHEIHEAAHELHGDIFECERRTVKELEHEVADPE